MKQFYEHSSIFFYSLNFTTIIIFFKEGKKGAIPVIHEVKYSKHSKKNCDQIAF